MERGVMNCVRSGKGVVASAMLWGVGRGGSKSVGLVRKAETSNGRGLEMQICDVVW